MNQTGLYLKKIHILLERMRNQEYRDCGLTGVQIDILEYLYFNDDGRNTLSDLSAFFGVQHTSMIHVLKILEKKELIGRRESARDSRRKEILLTEKGPEILESHLGSSDRHDELLFAGISEKDLQILERLLGQIYENLRQNQTKSTDIMKTAPERKGEYKACSRNQRQKI